jgi:hypothetical protein
MDMIFRNKESGAAHDVDFHEPEPLIQSHPKCLRAMTGTFA